MSDRLTAVRHYAHVGICEAMEPVVRYQNQLTNVIDMCLEMGYSCANDQPRFQQLAKELTEAVYAISHIETERSKLEQFTNRVMRIAANYRLLDPGTRWTCRKMQKTHDNSVFRIWKK